MDKLYNYLSGFSGKTILAVFPHMDDESFVAGGFFQVAKAAGLNIELISCSNGTDKASDGELAHEFDKACKILGLDKKINLPFKETEVLSNLDKIVKDIIKEIERINPVMVLTFDPNGITGNKDHVGLSVKILQELRKLDSTRPLLLWRISDEQEKNYFYKDRKLLADIKPTFNHNLSIKEALTKIKAIFCYRSQFKNFFAKVRVLEWYLFDHKEYFYLVDFKKDKYKLVYET